jgi:DNA-binding CsgD family transcriptional regulator
VYLDKNGTPRFEPIAPADGSSRADGPIAFEKAIALLFARCRAMGQLPPDFSVILALGRNFVGGLIFEEAVPVSCRAPISNLPRLTRRQHQVLSSVRQSLSNKEIGVKLGISERTVKFHVASLLRKFQVENRVRLILDTAMGSDASRSDGPRRSSVADAGLKVSGRQLPLPGARKDIALLKEFHRPKRGVVNAPRQRNAHEHPRQQHNQSR